MPASAERAITEKTAQYDRDSWIDQRVAVQPSKTHGLGLFATAPIAAEEIVIVWGGGGFFFLKMKYSVRKSDQTVLPKLLKVYTLQNQSMVKRVKMSG